MFTPIPITLPLDLVPPSLSAFFVASFTASVFSTVSIGWMAWENPWRLVRPGFLFAFFMAAFFQWPTVWLSDVILQSLPNAWFFSIAINSSPLALILWTRVTSWADIPARTISRPDFTWWQVAVPIVATIVFGSIFLAHVPFNCTALYSLFVDPSLTLLARELSIKLAGSSLGTYSYGALANTMGPVVLALAGASIVNAIARRLWLPLVIWPIVAGLTIMFVMLSGAKGLLVPSFLVVVITAAIWNRSFLGKALSIVILVALLGVCLPGFEAARERNTSYAGGYNFARCSGQLGACAEGKRLLASLRLRKASLGLSEDRITRMEKHFDLSCQGAMGAVEPAPPSPSASLKPSDTRSPPPSIDWFGRILTYAWAIYYRATIVPTQVASWHFLYAADKGEPGISALPIIRRLTGNSVNLPELVYQEYGAIYSGGDRTSTSTAPTSFALAFPAYAGWSGLAVAIGLMLWLDSVCAFIVRRLSTPFLGMAGGLMPVMCMNLVLSDYFTVLGSHGGAVAIALLAFYAATKNIRSFTTNVQKSVNPTGPR